MYDNFCSRCDNYSTIETTVKTMDFATEKRSIVLSIVVVCLQKLNQVASRWWVDRSCPSLPNKMLRCCCWKESNIKENSELFLLSLLYFNAYAYCSWIESNVKQFIKRFRFCSCRVIMAKRKCSEKSLIHFCG